MPLPTEKELREVLARFAQARIAHDVHPTGSTSMNLEDAVDTLCVMTGARTIEQALLTADTLLEEHTGRTHAPQEDETLAA
ncbi:MULTISPECIES: DUF5133 domain-containing protein [Streptomyces]|uniref:DUF5133 domain-containing protein n=2 Tax=Streptomyces TaxID=1883 RepID=A0ABS9JHX0_9ACTN|nr:MULTISPECIES: DUF5133 domain-containing protein [Streptomyces]MYU26711.1 DUF5133 domain-containing protein [Streptomyces sp. SID7810]CUW25531.1 hypothetical protein TUE45_00241 [Streptomyces reticuli]MCG0065166.1 DUF5133 domain-containing protein [Streptomyces tricolor]OYP13742.1 DUF5133 domain-containing protein [Streptomyces sp. FBKL.4005]BCM65544.1 hypothetical protein EASAB2608_00878 [Streptomyces sp. EAS-AB2608]